MSKKHPWKAFWNFLTISKSYIMFLMMSKKLQQKSLLECFQNTRNLHHVLTDPKNIQERFFAMFSRNFKYYIIFKSLLYNVSTETIGCDIPPHQHS